MVKIDLNNLFLLKSKYTLPHFLIIGAQKGGTSSLWHNLKKHPEIELSPNFRSKWPDGSPNSKEIHFFDREFDRGVEWYKKQFNNNQKVQGEVTPDYLVDNTYHERMFKTVPKAKLIIALRDPVTRVYSAYNHFQQEGYMLNVDYSTALTFEENYALDKKNKYKTGMIRYGFYIDQIENLLKYYPKEQILIIISEHLKKKPEENYNKVFDFLGVKKINSHVENIHIRSYFDTLQEDMKKELYRLYKPYNKRLFKLLGYEIKEWIEPYS